MHFINEIATGDETRVRRFRSESKRNTTADERYRSDEEVKNATSDYRSTRTGQEFFERGIPELVQRHDECGNMSSDNRSKNNTRIVQ